ncbi:DUF2254 domain-containing protein [Pseudohalocynthiibacter aestuariivivens]|nr:DUF2254 domain-containing protein [Pseudohalocynthiibacter aestuariivivens]QIE44670.1 DUF2254 domain-containing protein [Pseudohalocynthiibacter aestuariivivens]
MDDIRLLPATLLRMARQYARKLWVRVVAMGLLAVVSLGLAQLAGIWLPEEVRGRVNGASVDRLLDIIANAMLAVTIFSMTVMVTVYRSSSTQWTPRVHQLIMQDKTTQKTLAAFIGAYVYALVAIVMREVAVFGDDHAFVVFWVTVLVLVFVVVNLVRWVLHLQTFGSLLDTTRQVEDITTRQFKERLKTPCLGANPLPDDLPEDLQPICAKQSGYVQHIYPEGLNAAAKRFDVDLYLTQAVGSFVFLNQPLVWVGGVWDAKAEDDDSSEGLSSLIRDHVIIGDLRTYDQDPRFGLIVMGEMASKALSPGINDPGTAIDVITRIGRILSSYWTEEDNEESPELSRLYVPPLSPSDLIEDGYSALARDGAALVEVQQHLQATLGGLMRHPDVGLAKAAEHAARRYLVRAMRSLPFEDDRADLRSSAHADVRRNVPKSTAPGDHN